ncbi:MAG: DUF4440 domain-containing protein [Parvularculaceae bacterium]
MKTMSLALAATLLAAPAFAQETTPGSAKALQDAFAAAIVAEDAGALAALYTPDATSYGPEGDVSVGPAAIAASWAPFFEAFNGFTVSLDQTGEMDMGDAHAAWGLWKMSATPAGGGDATHWEGRFTDVSVATAEGWKYIVDHASPLAVIDADRSADPVDAEE